MQVVRIGISVLLAAMAPRLAEAQVPTLQTPSAPPPLGVHIIRADVELTLGQTLPQGTPLPEALHASLVDAAQDLGYATSLSDRPGTWQVSTRLRPVGDAVEVTLEATSDADPVVLSRREIVAPADVDVRALVMLRDLLRRAEGEGARKPRQERIAEEVAPESTAAWSPGRLVLAVNSTLFGGVVGYGIHASSGSDDPRLMYPLIAVGSGVGLGTAMIVSGEWNVGLGDAWFLSSAGWWPLVSAQLVAGSIDEVSTGSRWGVAMGAGALGLAVGTGELVLRGMGEGAAMMTHSGGVVGGILGGLTEFAYTADLETTPIRGLGVGAGAGWFVTSAAALFFQPPAYRVLVADLGAGLGGLGAAALASPLLIGDAGEGRRRGWAAAVMAGTAVGAGVGYWFSSPNSAASTAWIHPAVVPTPDGAMLTASGTLQ